MSSRCAAPREYRGFEDVKISDLLNAAHCFLALKSIDDRLNSYVCRPVPLFKSLPESRGSRPAPVQSASMICSSRVSSVWVCGMGLLQT